MLVIDASVAVEASFLGRLELSDEALAPPLLWSEARSAIHELGWRGEISLADAHVAHATLADLPISQRRHARLGETAWQLADELGWAKTYDAEYLALAHLLGCRLVTLDARLRRGADRLGFVVGPTELG